MKTLIVIETGAELMQLIRGELADEPHNCPPLSADAMLLFKDNFGCVELCGAEDYMLTAKADDVIRALVENVGLGFHVHY